MSSNCYNTETPYPIPFSYGITFKDALFTNLYVRQIEYWNKRLRTASETNISCYAREDEGFGMDDSNFVSIFFNNETISLLPVDEDDDYVCPYCLELYETDPNLVKEVTVIAREITKLKVERYVAQRFLAGLAMFDPPPEKLEEILGDGLTRICHNAFRSNGLNPATMLWDTPEPVALETFINEQQDIITAMQERMLLNMITL
jgi:hypothetical protein